KARHLELAAAVEHRALCQHQHIEAIEIGIEAFDGVGVADVEPRVVEAAEMRAFFRAIVACRRARAAHGDAGAFLAEGLGNAVADAAGAADHENLLATEIELAHLSGSSSRMALKAVF